MCLICGSSPFISYRLFGLAVLLHTPIFLIIRHSNLTPPQLYLRVDDDIKIALLLFIIIIIIIVVVVVVINGLVLILHYILGLILLSPQFIIPHLFALSSLSCVSAALILICIYYRCHHVVLSTGFLASKEVSRFQHHQILSLITFFCSVGEIPRMTDL